MTQIVTLMALSLQSIATHSACNLRVHENKCVKYISVLKIPVFRHIAGFIFFRWLHRDYTELHQGLNLKKTDLRDCHAVTGPIEPTFYITKFIVHVVVDGPA